MDDKERAVAVIVNHSTTYWLDSHNQLDKLELAHRQIPSWKWKKKKRSAQQMTAQTIKVREDYAALKRAGYDIKSETKQNLVYVTSNGELWAGSPCPDKKH
jgi:hypothetical protein